MIRHLKKLFKILNILKNILPIVVIISIAIILRIKGLFIPFIGRHGWNEALYASIVDDFIRNSRIYPYIVQYIRPDFNLGCTLYYFAALFIKIFGNYEWAYRIPVLLASTINVILIYFIGINIFKNRNLAYLSSFLYATIPMTMYYGTRFQHEEVMYALYLLSILFLIKFILSNNCKYLLESSFALGMSVFLVKQTFIVFFPLVLLFGFLLSESNYKKKMVLLTCTVCTFSVPFFVQLLLLKMLAPNDLEPVKFYLSHIILGSISRLLYSKKIYCSAINFTEIVESIELAYGKYLLLPILSAIGLLLLKKNSQFRSRNIELLLYLSTFIGLVSLYIMGSHLQNHEYHLYLVLLPMLILSSVSLYSLPKKFGVRNIPNSRKYYKPLGALILLLLLVLSSFILSYKQYWSYKDGFANLQAVKAGKYINNITSPNDIVLVQSPVIGFYSKRPNLHWGYLWMLDEERIKKLSFLSYFFEYKPLLKYYSIYDPSVKPEDIIKVLEYWKPTVVVLSPDVYDVFSTRTRELYPLIAYLNLFYETKTIIEPYTIKMNRNLSAIISSNRYTIYMLRSKYKLLLITHNGIPLIMVEIFFDDELKTGISAPNSSFKIIRINQEFMLLDDKKCGKVTLKFLNGVISINAFSNTSFVEVIFKYIDGTPGLTKVSVIKNTINLKMDFMKTSISIMIPEQDVPSIIQNPDAVIIKKRDCHLNLEIRVKRLC